MHQGDPAEPERGAGPSRAVGERKIGACEAPVNVATNALMAIVVIPAIPSPLRNRRTFLSFLPYGTFGTPEPRLLHKLQRGIAIRAVIRTAAAPRDRRSKTALPTTPCSGSALLRHRVPLPLFRFDFTELCRIHQGFKRDPESARDAPGGVLLESDKVRINRREIAR